MKNLLMNQIHKKEELLLARAIFKWMLRAFQYWNHSFQERIKYKQTNQARKSKGNY